jgi:nitrate/TMAO reductase-like tetraheme cytochrome c subunit
MSESPESAQRPDQPSGTAPRRKWKKRFKVLGVTSVVFIVVMASLAVSAEYYTAQPQFCASCHIMEPYYSSWQKDAHSGKGDARCVDCHYAPGEHHTPMAKFRGLSQLASYFSGRSGAGRPKARVNDASCMTSGCHGDQKFMTTELQLGNVKFTHAKHLDPQGKITVQKTKELADMRAKLTQLLTPNQLAAIELLAKPISHATERNEQITDFLIKQNLQSHRDDVLVYAELLHTDVRLEHLKGLKCSSCHQFNASLQSHFSVAQTTCFTCHFINEPFNANSGRCLSCHEPPTAQIPIHEGETSQQLSATSKGTVMMNHATIVANNVNCVSCHADLIHGSGVVTRRDCQNCHDQDKFLEDFDRLTTDVVKNYHRIHAAGQRARCNDCHQVIDHRLTPVAAPGDAASLLAPVRKDCQHCHPDHHNEQVNLLLGQGGHLNHGTGVPNPMTGSRVNCQACHTEPGNDLKGEAVIRSTMESCSRCHSQEYEQLFTHWHEMIKARQAEAEQLLAEIGQKIPITTQPEGAEPGPVDALIQRARENIKLVRTANGIHNRNYSLMLLDQAIDDLHEARKRLK